MKNPKDSFLVILEYIKTSIWAYPSAIVIVHAIAAYAILQFDYRHGSHLLEFLPGLSMTPSASRQVLILTASSMISVTGIAFSISIVTLSLASNQFGPKVLRNYLTNNINKFVLGHLIGVFVFGLIALIFMEERTGTHLFYTVLADFILTLTAVSAFIYFIHNISKVIQADHIIASIGQELENAIDSTTNPAGDKIPPSLEKETWNRIVKDKRRHEICAKRSGYIQSINYDSLLQLAVDNDCHIEVQTRAGKFVFHGMCTCIVHTSDHANNELVSRIRDCLILGEKRTPIQDLEFAIDQLVQVGLRALSPGINDSHTAMSCIDWLSSSLSMMSIKQFPVFSSRDDQEIWRLNCKEFCFPGALEAAINPIRQSCNNNVMVNIHLLGALNSLYQASTREVHKHAIVQQANAVYSSCKNANMIEADFEAVKKTFARLKT